MVPTKLLTQRLLNCLESRRISVEAIYLFGSQARRQAGPESDIDMLVVSPAFSRRGFWARCAWVGEAISELHEPVQIYPVTPEELENAELGGFLEAIRPDLKPLYQRAKARVSANRR
jgi:predicted nucleotidyltransferase